MRRMLSVVLLFASALGGKAKACDRYGKTGIVEDNDLKIYVGQKGGSNIDEASFNKVIGRLESIYRPIVAKRGGDLQVLRKWTDPTVNAYALQREGIWYVAMFGGLARHSAITEDGLALVMCHEIGHHIGGAPKKTEQFGQLIWATNEGQADYFATLKCLRRYFEKDDNVRIVRRLKVPKAVRALCKQTFKDPAEQALCMRSQLAGRSVSGLFHSLRKLKDPLSFVKKSKASVVETYHGHPQPQCRLDTYVSGSICKADLEVPLVSYDADQGVCSRRLGESEGVRPTCWYKPE